jgi:drug/metabolite transporter (DMT)-like permease
MDHLAARTNRPRTLAVAGLVAVAIAWGAIPLIVREDVPALELVAVRVWLGGAALAAFLGLRSGLRMPSTHRGRLLAVGVLRAGHWVAFFLALKSTTVAVALSVLYLGPISAAVIAPRLLGERAPRRAVAGLAVAFAGVILVMQPWDTGAAGVTTEGVAWALVSAVLVAAVMLVAKPAAEAHGGLVVATAELLVAAIVLVPWAGAAASLAPEYWWQFLMLGVGLTGVAGALYWTAMSRLSVATVGVLMHLEPASAALWALVVLNEQPGSVAWAGILLVIAGGIMAVTAVRDEEVADVGPTV